MKRQRTTEKVKKPFPLSFLLLLAANTVVLFGCYLFFVMAQNINWVYWLYYAALGVSLIGYLLYNRGMAREGYTLDTLPVEWSAEKKAAFLSDRDERKRKSRWVLTLIFPLTLSIFAAIIYLFFGDALGEMLQTVTEALKK